MMKAVASIFGGVLLFFALVGARNYADTTAIGGVALQAVNGSGISGTVMVSTNGPHSAFLTVDATNMGSLTSYGLAVMTANCTSVIQMLNPIETDAVGDGSSNGIMATAPDPAWWVGILSGTSANSEVVACGPVQLNTTPPTMTPRPAGTPVHAAQTVVPVQVVSHLDTPTPSPTRDPSTSPYGGH